MDVLQQYCSLPSFQRLCCKSCRPGNSTKTSVTARKPLSPSTKPNRGKSTSTTTRAPTRVKTSTASHKTSSSTVPASTTGKDATSVGTQWFYTSASTGTLGYTSAPDHQYTTTRIQENTTYVIPTSGPTITSPSVRNVNDLTFIPSTSVPYARTDIPHASDKESTVSDLPGTFTAEVLTTTTEPTPKQATLTWTSSPIISSTTASATTARRPKKVDETSESNAIDIPYQTVPLDNEFSQNNIISRRGFVFLRERTRNKRIQELLEEKRNFLRRMKRAQGI